MRFSNSRRSTRGAFATRAHTTKPISAIAPVTAATVNSLRDQCGDSDCTMLNATAPTPTINSAMPTPSIGRLLSGLFASFSNAAPRHNESAPSGRLR